MIIVAVSGWRDWTDLGFIRRHLTNMTEFLGGPVHFRVGDADGVDRLSRGLMIMRGWSYHLYVADWAKYPKAAGPIRNLRMLKGVEEDNTVADWLLAFPQPGVDREKDSGTWRCMKQARKLGISVWVPGYREDEKPCGQDSLFG